MPKYQLTKNDFYPLADYHPENFRHHNIKAKWNGEKRQPKKGEWYLSGAIIEAYQAKNDLSSVFHIATLCQVVTQIKEITTIIKEVEND